MNTIARVLAAGGVALAIALPAVAENLPVSQWVPVEVDGKVFEPSPETHIRFDTDARFFGNAGCNTMRGSYVTNQGAILLGPAATTMMLCPGEVSQQEQTFLRGLGRARFFERDGAALTLKDGGGLVVMRLVQNDGI